MYVFVCNLVKRPEFGKRVNLSGARDRRELGQGEENYIQEQRIWVQRAVNLGG